MKVKKGKVIKEVNGEEMLSLYLGAGWEKVNEKKPFNKFPTEQKEKPFLTRKENEE